MFVSPLSMAGADPIDFFLYFEHPAEGFSFRNLPLPRIGVESQRKGIRSVA